MAKDTLPEESKLFPYCRIAVQFYNFCHIVNWYIWVRVDTNIQCTKVSEYALIKKKKKQNTFGC